VKRVPKSFKIMAHTINVRIVSKKDWEALTDKYEELEDSVAWWIAADNLIVIMRQSNTQMLHCFFHELSHAVLHYMNSPLTHNEEFVDQMGGLLAQVMDTAK
jgi:aspartate carbamoyltransferase catalytic subunit